MEHEEIKNVIQNNPKNISEMITVCIGQTLTNIDVKFGLILRWQSYSAHDTRNLEGKHVVMKSQVVF